MAACKLMEIVYVDSPESLESAIQIMEQETTYLAIDTEFRREDTYFPQLCLIQVATQNHVFLIDAINIADVSPFFRILTNENMLKVFHSGRQDLEIFCHLMQGQVAISIFDTQIAAMLTGYGESAGFESLVYKLLKVSLDKSSRHTNWTQRPLKEEQKSYAVNDVLYLRPLYEQMVKKLAQKGRLDWMKEEVVSLETASFLIVPPSEAWRRLSLSHPTARHLAVLKALTEWRETTVQKTDTPRSWLLKDEVILDIVIRKPTTPEQLRKIPHFPWDDMLLRDEVFAIIQTVAEIPEDELPALEGLPVLSKSKQNILEMLKLLLKMIADQLDVNPKLIADKEDLVLWLSAEEPSARPAHTAKGWRYDMFWKHAQELLDGNTVLRIQNDQIVIQPTV
jgi:ribonuclease D